jgi:hypothetical protein
LVVVVVLPLRDTSVFGHGPPTLPGPTVCREWQHVATYLVAKVCRVTSTERLHVKGPRLLYRDVGDASCAHFRNKARPTNTLEEHTSNNDAYLKNTTRDVLFHR